MRSGLGFRVEGLGFRAFGSGSRVLVQVLPRGARPRKGSGCAGP
jgi:hypothetical protein